MIFKFEFWIFYSFGPKKSDKLFSIFHFIPQNSVEISSHFTPNDSPFNALHFCLWVHFERMKRSAANSRKPAGVTAPSTASRRFSPSCGQTVTLMESESKDFRKIVSRAIDWCIHSFDPININRFKFIKVICSSKRTNRLRVFHKYLHTEPNQMRSAQDVVSLTEF